MYVTRLMFQDFKVKLCWIQMLSNGGKFHHSWNSLEDVAPKGKNHQGDGSDSGSRASLQRRRSESDKNVVKMW